MEMRVYKDITAYQPKPFLKLTWRQLGAVGIGGPLALLTFAGITWGYLSAHGWQYTGLGELLAMTEDESSLISTATTVALFPTFVVFLPFAVYGWIRPKGLKPEHYLPYWFDYMKNAKELCYGSDSYDQGSARDQERHESLAGRGGQRRTRQQRRHDRKVQRFVPSEHPDPAVPEKAQARQGR